VCTTEINGCLTRKRYWLHSCRHLSTSLRIHSPTFTYSHVKVDTQASTKTQIRAHTRMQVKKKPAVSVGGMNIWKSISRSKSKAFQHQQQTGSEGLCACAKSLVLCSFISYLIPVCILAIHLNISSNRFNLESFLNLYRGLQRRETEITTDYSVCLVLPLNWCLNVTSIVYSFCF